MVWFLIEESLVFFLLSFVLSSQTLIISYSLFFALIIYKFFFLLLLSYNSDSYKMGPNFGGYSNFFFFFCRHPISLGFCIYRIYFFEMAQIREMNLKNVGTESKQYSNGITKRNQNQRILIPICHQVY